MEIQRCINSGEYTTVIVTSHSDPLRRYNVLVIDPNLPNEAICECDGYGFRGQCRHQREALAKICGWQEGDEEIQTPEQERDEICPRCSDDTEWVRVAE